MASWREIRIVFYSQTFKIWNFFDSWFGSIPWQRLALAIPFLTTVVTLSAIYLFGGDLKTGFRNRLVQSRIDRALGSGDVKTAKLLLFRMSQSDPANADYRFGLAQVHLAENEPELAIRIVRGLVFTDEIQRAKDWDKASSDLETADKTGPNLSSQSRFRGTDPRFLLWMIEHVYDKTPWEDLDARNQDDCLAMLATLYSLAPGDHPIAGRYAERLLQAGRYQDALPVLVSLIPTAPGIGLRAAIIAKNQGLHDKANTYAQQSQARFSELVQLDPGSAELAVSLARCQVFLGQFTEAIASIDQAIKNATDDKMVALLFGIRVEAIVAWADAIQTKPVTSLADRLRLLQLLDESLRHAPGNSQLLQLVIRHVLAVTDKDDQQVADVRQALVNGVSPELAHFIHGTAATIQGRFEQARIHLEIAAQAFPDSDVILNNLAHVMAQGDNDDDLATALKLADTSIRRVGQPTAYHRDTRGRILHKLGRWQDAVSDLQHAVREPELALGAHQLLADCYQQLGLSDLAVVHTKAAEQIASKRTGK